MLNFRKLIEKVDFGEIVKRHIQTLSNIETKKAEFGDYFLFLILPVFLSFTLLYSEIDLKIDTVNLICTVLSIFIGLFLNVIVLIFDMVNKETNNPHKKTLLRELIFHLRF